jgi:type IV pilus assembly protein PilA
MRVQSKRTGDERGFTPIELIVGVLAIGILLTVAVPTFVGARSRSQDGAAKSSLRNALTAANVIYTDTMDYAGADIDGLAATDRSLTFVASPTPSTQAEQISALAGTTWAAAARSASGTCFLIKTTTSGAVTYGKVTTGACTGARADTVATADAW